MFVNGILVAELAGTAVAFGAFLFGWFAFPRTRDEEGSPQPGTPLQS